MARAVIERIKEKAVNRRRLALGGIHLLTAARRVNVIQNPRFLDVDGISFDVVADPHQQSEPNCSDGAPFRVCR